MEDLHGVDVLVYGMHVHKYGFACLESDQGLIYISFVDSIKKLPPNR